MIKKICHGELKFRILLMFNKNTTPFLKISNECLCCSGPQATLHLKTGMTDMKKPCMSSRILPKITVYEQSVLCHPQVQVKALSC